MSSSNKILGAAVAAVVFMCSGLAFAQAGGATSTSEGTATTQTQKPAHEKAPVSDAVLEKRAHASAHKAQTELRRLKKERLKLAEAARTNNEAEAKAILHRHGFTAKQLAGAKITLDDKTGGGALGDGSKIKITIDASCCPLTIVITIEL